MKQFGASLSRRLLSCWQGTKNNRKLIGSGFATIGLTYWLFNDDHLSSSTSVLKILEDSILKPVHAFSVDCLPAADYSTFPYRSNLWNIPNREEQLKKIKDGEVDLCIVGDGLIAASVAYEATLRGYSVCLLSPNDFISPSDEFSLNSDMMFHHVLEGNASEGLMPNFMSQYAVECEEDGKQCKFYSHMYNSMKEKIEKRNHMFSIAPHLMREFRVSEIFANGQRFNYYKQLWQLLEYEYFIYGKDLWMESSIFDTRNQCEGRFGILRNKYQERSKDETDFFKHFKDSRNIFRCVTYFDSGILNLPRFITSMALTTSAMGNIALNHSPVKNIDYGLSQVTFSDKFDTSTDYQVRFKKLLVCETPNSENLIPRKVKTEYHFTLPSISNQSIVTEYGKFIPHYRYTILSIPSENLSKLSGILKLGNFSRKDIYSSSKSIFDNELKLIKQKHNGALLDNVVRVVDTTKDYYASQLVLNYLYRSNLGEVKSDEPIYGSENFVYYLTQTMKQQFPHLHDDIIRYMKFNYGDRCLNVLREGAKHTGDNEKVIYQHRQLFEDLPYLESEIRYLVRVEHCYKALDVIVRCQMYKYDPLRVLIGAEKLLNIMKEQLKWNDERYIQEKQEVIQFLMKYTSQ